MTSKIFLFQTNLIDEVKSLFSQLENFSNPIYYSIFIALFTIVIIVIFFKYIYAPVQVKHSIEKEILELKNTRLMALFAELDPDPIIRVDSNGEIINTNDAALEINNSKHIIGKKLIDLLPFIDINIKKYIEENKTALYTKKVNTKYYSILFRGNSYLDIGQIYFRDITEQKEIEKELITAQKQSKSLSNHLQNILEEERHRIARELHDGIGQTLSLTRLNINNLISDSISPKTISQLNKVVSFLDSTISQLKEISQRLKPKILDEMGLEPALTSLVNDVSTEMNVKGSINFSDFDKRMDPKFEICIYRVVQESLNNIIKHSRATEFNIQLIKNKKIIRILISDNGVGFNPDKVLASQGDSGGMGILNIHERIINYDGILKIDSSPGNGTIIIVEIPNKRALWKIKNISVFSLLMIINCSAAVLQAF